MLLFRYDGDGWDPRINGHLVCFGGGGIPSQGIPPAVRVYDIDRQQLVPLGGQQTSGRSARWLGPSLATWLVEAGRMSDERWICPVGGTPVRTADDPALVAANDFEAGGGHWASWLAEGRRLVLDGQIIPGSYLGVEMAWPYLLSVRDEREFVTFRDGVERSHFQLPPRANAWTISTKGYIGYGYFWQASVMTPAGKSYNATVSEWEQEGVPVVVHLPSGETWIWTHTVRPRDQRSLVVGRPWYDSDAGRPGTQLCIVIPDFPAVSLAASWDDLDQRFILAGCSDRGGLQIHAVSKHSPRELVVDISLPPRPPDPKPPTNPDPQEPSMRLSTEVKAIISQYADRYPIPSGPAGSAKEEAARQWCIRLAQHLAWSRPADGWCVKRSGPGHDISKDTIARLIDRRLLVWDLFVGVGTDDTRLNLEAESADVTGQLAEPVTPKNWLEDGQPNDPGGNPSVPPEWPGDATIARLRDVLIVPVLERQETALDALNALVNVTRDQTTAVQQNTQAIQSAAAEVVRAVREKELRVRLFS